MPSIAQHPASVRWLAESGLADRLRNLADPPTVPDDDVLAAAIEFENELEIGPGPYPGKSGMGARCPKNRAGKRATRAADRRSVDPLPKPRKRLTRADVRRREHERTQDRAYAAELGARSLEWKPPPGQVDGNGKAWRTCPETPWRCSQDVVSNTSSNAWRYWARRIPNKPALGALRRAALCPRPDGTCRRTWSSERARRIAALGLSLLMLARHTVRKGPWKHIVRGIPIALMQSMLCYPDGSRMPSIGAITGRHRGVGSEHERGQVGYLRALEMTGFIAKATQWYPDAADWETGKLVTCKDGRTFRAQLNRYWIVDNPPGAAPRPGMLELEREGWLSLDETPVAVRRYALPVEPTASPP